MRCKFCGRRGERGFERYTDIPVYLRCAARDACRARMEQQAGSAEGRRALVAGRVVESIETVREGYTETTRLRLSEGVVVNTYSDQHGGDVEWFLAFEDVA